MDKGSARNSERFEHPHALRIQSGAKPNFIFAIRKPAGRFRDSRCKCISELLGRFHPFAQ